MFYRDKERCQLCKKDVSGQIYLENKYHLDHILPLAESGTNNSTIFQLLCDQCNLKTYDLWCLHNLPTESGGLLYAGEHGCIMSLGVI